MRKLDPIINNMPEEKGFFQRNCLDLSAGKEFCVAEIFKQYDTTKQDQFYSIICDCLTAIGFLDVRLTRSGDPNNRMDALIVDETNSIPVEIKSPTEIEYIDVKSIRQALENKLILLSRKWHPTTKETTTLSIGYQYPNERSEVDTLVDYFQGAFDLNIGLIDFKTLLKLRWMTEIENNKIDLHHIINLKGKLL